MQIEFDGTYHTVWYIGNWMFTSLFYSDCEDYIQEIANNGYEENVQ